MRRRIGEGYSTEELIESAVSELKGIKEVQAVYLFGSHARGEAGPMSDIDICVVAPKDLNREKKSDLMGPCSDVLNVHVFWDMPAHIRVRVIKEGKLLFEADWVANHRAQLQTIKEYLDFRPLFHRQIMRSLSMQ